MKRVNKKVSVILLLAILLHMLSINIAYAVTFNDEDSFKTYLSNNNMSYTSKNGTYTANRSTFNTYGQVVYGSPFGDFKNGEYRYLGYAYDEETKVTNQRFPEDAGGADGTFETYTYLVIPGATGAWGEIRDEDQLWHMQNTKLSYDGVTYNLYAGTLPLTKDKVRPLTAPGWFNGFSVRVEFLGTQGERRYATMTGAPMAVGTNITCGITAPATVTMKNYEDSVSFSTTASANVSLTGAAKASHIDELTLNYRGTTSKVTGSTTASNSANVTLSREDYAPGTYTIALNANAAVKTKYGDNLSGSATKNVTLIVETPLKPYVTAKATANPEKIKLGDTDLSVAVNVEGTLSNISDMSKVDKWVLYCRKDEESNAQEKAIAAAKTAQASFAFTVPKTAVTGDSYTQNFKATARAFMKDGTYVDASAYCSTYIYKDTAATPQPTPTPTPDPTPEPTTDPNKPPRAVIKIYKEDGETETTTVKAGEGVFIDGSQSWDEDGYIETYAWTTSGAKYTLEGCNGSNTYPEKGTYPIVLKVADDNGKTASASKFITVTDPYPVAVLDISGKLKNNRLVNIDTSGSSSPQMYPITKRTIAISPVSGTGANSSFLNITSFDANGIPQGDFYSGAILNKASAKELFKFSGLYDVTLTIENSKGLKDTTTQRISIAKDQPPITNFSTVKNLLREVNINNEYYAEIIINDLSYSPDGDYIKYRKVSLIYDANNNGIFGDAGDQTIIVNESSDRNEILTKKTLKYKRKDIGMYRVVIEAVEGFDP